MRTVEVATDPPYAVRVGRGVLARVPAEAGAGAALVSDARVAPLHGAACGLGEPLWVLPAGEEAKSFARLEELLGALAEAGLDRSATLVALGGGAVGDVTGLAAALWMRGVGVVQCPTTLLAMVDASVGGKTAVNLAAGKNLAGVVHQPRAVLADTDTLATLPPVELRSGLGEVLKSALVGDAALLELLEERADEVAAGDADVLEEVVVRCVRVKAAVVAADPHETGPRRALNLGHTFAHAVERVAGYGRIPHGVAVAGGIGAALAASERAGLLADAALPGRVARLARRLGLPAGIAELRGDGLALPAAELAEAMALDKKGREGTPRFVLARAAGRLELDATLEARLLAEVLA